jgi:membrane protease YdiL (CAAX protease family)
LAALSPHLVGDSPNLGMQVVLQLVFCLFAVAIIVLVLRYERLPLRSIGLRRPDGYTIPTAVGLFALGFLLQVLLIGPLVQRWGQAGAAAGLAELSALPIWFRLVLGVTGGIVEETLYRGYAVERLATLTGRRWLGAVLATVAFTAAHIPAWGLGFALVADLPAGVLLVLFYLWRRDLVANMLAHSAGIIVAMLTTVP